MLQLVDPAKAPGAVPVIALAHNERNIIEPFLTHYRALGPVHFIMVDDRSDDGTAELLRAQPDVTLYAPKEGSTYQRDKHAWRAGLLDQYADGQWAVTPDVDELLVIPGPGRRMLADYLHALSVEGAEAVLTVMVDMYADRPLSEHRFPGPEGLNLGETFPFFDGPDAAPLGYRMHDAAGSKDGPITPQVVVHGGMRERLFRLSERGTSAPVRRVLDDLAGLDGAMNPAGATRLTRRLVRAMMKHHFRDALHMQKAGLIRWRSGLRYRNAHQIVGRLAMSESICAFLHYKFTRGVEGLEYTARRGAHAGSSAHYKQMIARRDILDRSPVYAGTRLYEGRESLAGIIRDIP